MNHTDQLQITVWKFHLHLADLDVEQIHQVGAKIHSGSKISRWIRRITLVITGLSVSFNHLVKHQRNAGGYGKTLETKQSLAIASRGS